MSVSYKYTRMSYFQLSDHVKTSVATGAVYNVRQSFGMVDSMLTV